MDDPPSDGNERAAVLFMASTDETVTGPLKDDLEKQNHQVCVFTDDAHLIEALQAEKPGLLIYDGTTGKPENYEAVRRIKADETLWSVPVLILTGATTMDGLLQVIESNADNFIAPPYNHPDHLSLIEGMLGNPVERLTREEAAKQFRVRQDDRIYVVLAARRKLLEYLLSSFEVVAGASSALSLASSEIRDLTGSVKELKDTVARQTVEIGTLNGTIREKEQHNIALTRSYEELQETIGQQVAEIASLAAESDTRKTSLETVQNALMEEETRCADLEKTLHDLTSALDKQKSMNQEDKTRFVSAEQEIKALKEVKIQTEQDLNLVIAGLNSTVERQDTELARLKNELETEARNRALAEEQAGLRERELEQFNTSHQSETEIRNRQYEKLREALAMSAAELETERETRRISEEKTKTLVRELEDRENRVRSSHEEKERVITDQAAMIAQLQEKLDAAGQTIQSPEAGISNFAREKLHAGNETGAPLSEPGTVAGTDTTGSPDPEITPAGKPDSHSGRDDQPESGKERHLVQQPLFPEEEKAVTQNTGLVLTEVPHLPTIVTQASPPVIREGSYRMQQWDGPGKDPASGESSGNIARVLGASDAENIVPGQGSVTGDGDPGESTTSVRAPAGTAAQAQPREDLVAVEKGQDLSASEDTSEEEMAARLAVPGSDTGFRERPVETSDERGGPAPGGEVSITGSQWLDLIRWVHKTDVIPRDQRLRILRLGRLIQKDGKLTKKQQDQVREILSSAYELGYRSR